MADGSKMAQNERRPYYNSDKDNGLVMSTEDIT
jgi:hypothetical protein